MKKCSVDVNITFSVSFVKQEKGLQKILPGERLAGVIFLSLRAC
jgi:hypothetical protein